MSCACGAGVPHGHSLFILGGHYHGAEQVYFNAGAGEKDNQHHGHKVDASSASGPQLAGRIMHSADRVAVALPLSVLSGESWQRFVQPVTISELDEGRIDTLESPPPKSAFQT